METLTQQKPIKIEGSLVGLKCSSCISTVRGIFKQCPGAFQLDVNLSDSRFEAIVDPAFSFPKFAKQVKRLGFFAERHSSKLRTELHQGSSKSPMASGNIWQEGHRLLTHAGIALGLSAITMMLSLTLYFGMSVEEEPMLFILFQRIIFVSGMLSGVNILSAFVPSTLFAIRRRVLHPDLSIVLCVTGLMLLSVQTYTTSVSQHLYLDSLSVFGVFLFLSRYSTERIHHFYRRIAQKPYPIESWSVFRLTNNIKSSVSVSELVKGDTVILSHASIVPMRCRLISEQAEFSEAWLTGEVNPLLLCQGATVKAGSQVLAEQDTVLQVLESFELSDFYQYLNSAAMKQSSNDSKKFDRYRRVYLFFTLCMLAVGACLFFFMNWAEAILRIMALALVLCPCVLSLVDPISKYLVLSSLRKKGIIIRTFDKLKHVVECKTIVFDKTGTLSRGTLRLQNTASLLELPETHIEFLLYLTENNHHPKAKCIHSHLSEMDLDVPNSQSTIGKRKILPGKGVELKVGEVEARLESNPNGNLTYIFSNSVVATFEFEEVFESSLIESLHELKKMGCKLKIYSGDSQDAVSRFVSQAPSLEIEAYGGLSATEKAQKISAETEKVLFCGDGFNDMLAMTKSHTSIAIVGSRPEVTQCADIFVWQDMMVHIKDLKVAISIHQNLIRIGLTYTVFYNIALATLALLGFLSPVAAAIVMPIGLTLYIFGTLSASKYLEIHNGGSV